MALPEPILDSGELKEALAFIRQKKEGLLPGRTEGGLMTFSALPESTLHSSRKENDGQTSAAS